MNQDKINIAIDGYSSCGKGTLAKELAKFLNYRFIDSGSMYRAVTLHCINQGIEIGNTNQITEELANISIGFDYNTSRERFEVTLNGKNVESEVREMRVASHVSEIAAQSAVRKYLVAMQQEIGKNGGVVMDGRDIGTVVFPDAELKIFMTASVEVRSERRFNELIKAGKEATLSEVMANLTERDRIDSSREDSPLQLTDDYKVLDNTELSKNEQLEIAKTWALECINQN